MTPWPTVEGAWIGWLPPVVPLGERPGLVRERMQARLDELKRELEAGQTELQGVQMRENYLREATLRISGAIQVLEEFLADGAAATTAPSSEAQNTPTQ